MNIIVFGNKIVNISNFLNAEYFDMSKYVYMMLGSY